MTSHYFYSTGFCVPVKTANSDYCNYDYPSLYSMCGYPMRKYDTALTLNDPCAPAFRINDLYSAVKVVKTVGDNLFDDSCSVAYSCRDKTCAEAVKPI